MTFRFSLGIWSHYKASLRVRLRPSPVLILHLIVPVLSLFLLINLWQMRVRSPLAYLVVLLATALYTPLVMFLIVVLRRSQARGAYNDMTVTVDDTGVTQQTIIATSRVEWTQLIDVQESVGLFLFYVTAHVAIPLPVPVVEREGLLSQLRTVIVTNRAARASSVKGEPVPVDDAQQIVGREPR